MITFTDFFETSRQLRALPLFETPAESIIKCFQGNYLLMTEPLEKDDKVFLFFKAAVRWLFVTFIQVHRARHLFVDFHLYCRKELVHLPHMQQVF